MTDCNNCVVKLTPPGTGGELGEMVERVNATLIMFYQNCAKLGHTPASTIAFAPEHACVRAGPSCAPLARHRSGGKGRVRAPVPLT